MSSAADCFAVDHRLLPLDDALALIAERVQPVTGSETLPLAQCAGRILAEPLIATMAQPPFANAAMDGYALRAADLASGRRFTLTGRVAAGHVLTETLPAGGAVRIFTGAPLPPGCDSVVMQEDCRIEGDHVILPDEVQPGSHVRPSGIDFKAGDRLLAAGRRLRPQDIGIAAATGASHLAVRRRLRVGLFSTGDELVDPGVTLASGQIHDGNRPMLAAALGQMGFEVRDLGRLVDRRDSLITAFGLAALDHDALISSGGVSVGGEDHVRDALAQLGQIHFWKLALKPGKPLALGQIGACAFIGLPGNPVSSLISLLVVGRTVLHRLAGATLEAHLPPPLWLPTAAPLAASDNRRNFLRAALRIEAGRCTALPYVSQDSSLISSLVASDGLIEVGPGQDRIGKGTPVPFYAFDTLMQ